MTEFSIDHDRLDRYRAEADKARGESRAARDRVQDAHHELREAQDKLRRLERSLPGEPRVINVRDEKGNVHRRAESQHDIRIEGVRRRVEKAQAELNRLAAAQNDGAAAREHAIQLFSRLSAHAAGYSR